MELTIRLDPDRAQKLAYLQQHSSQNPESLLSQAIDEIYQEINPNQQSAYEIFEKFDLIGCMDGDETLPQTDSPQIREQIQKKRQQGRL